MTIDNDNFHTIITSILILFIIITVLFSSMIILTIVYNWSVHCRSIRNLLVCNSCVTLFYYAVATSVEIAFITKTDPTPNRDRSALFCRFRAAFYLSACINSALSYLIQAISRYFITILYQHKILITFRTNWILIIISWGIGFLLPALMFISPIAYQYESESRMCFLTSKAFPTSFPVVIIVFCIPLHIIIFLYVLILYQSTRKGQTNSNTFAVLRMKRSLKVFRNILVSISILTIGGTPYFICVVFTRIMHIPWQLHSLSILFISLSTTLNALALFFINKQVRTLFCNTIKCQQREYTEQVLNGVVPMNQIMPQSIQMLPLIK